MPYTIFKIGDLFLKLRLTILDLVNIERVKNKSPLDILNSYTGKGSLSDREDLLYILYAALQNYHNIDINGLYELYDLYLSMDGSDTALCYVLIGLFKDIGLIPDENEKPNTESKETESDNDSDEEELDKSSLEKSFKELRDKCVEAGIPENEFWNSTYGEIIRRIKRLNTKMMNDARQTANMDYVLANLIGISVGRLFSNESSYPEIQEVYPHLFNDVKSNKPTEEEMLRAKEEEMKLKFMQRAQAANAQREYKRLMKEISEREKEKKEKEKNSNTPE